MPGASWAQTSFLGGEISQTAQGRFSDPLYETALGVCINGIPIEAGAWTRRPGFAHASTTRGGAPGRTIGFNYTQSGAVTVEHTDGHIRFRAGARLLNTGDSIGIAAISTANPAVMQTSAAVTWATLDQGYFSFLGTSCPLLQNRVFALTKVDTTHFSLTDAITGATIDGATLGVGSLAAGTTFNRILDLTTPYIGGAWAALRQVQADIKLSQGTTPGAVLLSPTIKPYVLQVATLPTASTDASFTLAAANLKDGPYFDPVPGGTLVTPNALIGLVTMTLSFTAYDATRAYAIGDYVLSVGVNYKSLQDANLNNTPAGAPTFWTPVSAADAIGPNGFQGSDVGRMVRLQSAPDLWSAAITYSTGQIVAYGNPETYWTALAGNVNNIPGIDTINWALAGNTATRWTWGKITGLSNIINRALAGSVNIGDMTGGGGLAAAFDGNLSQTMAASANKTTSGGVISGGTVITLSSYVGKNYSGASDQKISQAIVYPTIDQGAWQATVGRGITSSVTWNLRGKASLPASASDGSLLGTSGAAANFVSPLLIISTDQTTAWKYVWIEQITAITFTFGAPSYSVTNCIGEVSLFNPPGAGTSQGFTLQILGDALLNTKAIRTWRMGLYSDTTGWPTVGTYHEDGRLWLFGSNRADGSRSNDPFNFAPTNPNGLVPDNAAISYRFNAKDVNQILWAESDDRGILMGTQAAEWLISATTQNLPLSPTNIQAHPVSHYGSANLEPRRAGGVLVFVQRLGRKLLEFFPDVFSGRLTAPNLTRDSKHLTASAIAEIAYQAELAPIIWARRTDGALVGWTYKRENLMSSQGPAFCGGHRHTLGSGRVVESIAAGPSTDGNLDALTIVTNDPATGIRHVEVMTNIWEEGGALVNAWHCDDAVAPSSFTADLVAQTLTLNGLWHLNGKIVSAFVAGVDAGDYTVANGSITVPIDGTANSANGTSLLTVAKVTPYLAGTLPAVVGFTYNSDGQVLRPGPQKDSGAANGPAFGKISRAHQLAVLMVDTVAGMNGTAAAGISFGSFFTASMKWPALVRFPYQQIYPADQLFSGVYWSPLENPYSFDEGQICWRISRPYPATIAALGAFQVTQDR